MPSPTPTPERKCCEKCHSRLEDFPQECRNRYCECHMEEPIRHTPESRLREEWAKHLRSPKNMWNSFEEMAANFFIDKLSQERERWLSETCERCGCTREKWSKKGILCDFKISNGAHTFQVPFSIPSGVSQWLEYGKKFGYDKFFLGKERELLVGEVEKLQVATVGAFTPREEEIIKGMRDSVLDLLTSKN